MIFELSKLLKEYEEKFGTYTNIQPIDLNENDQELLLNLFYEAIETDTPIPDNILEEYADPHDDSFFNG